MDTTIAPATLTEGGDTVVSFGSGNQGGRTQASAQGRGATRNASPAQVRALRSRISRNTDISARQRNALLREIDDNRKPNGNITRGILADIASDFDELR